MFDETTSAAGLGLNTRYVGWGTAFIDFDNDARVDLIQVNGHVFPEAGNLSTEGDLLSQYRRPVR